jgi:hypothetical protein
VAFGTKGRGMRDRKEKSTSSTTTIQTPLASTSRIPVKTAWLYYVTALDHSYQESLAPHNDIAQHPSVGSSNLSPSSVRNICVLGIDVVRPICVSHTRCLPIDQRCCINQGTLRQSESLFDAKKTILRQITSQFTWRNYTLSKQCADLHNVQRLHAH